MAAWELAAAPDEIGPGGRKSLILDETPALLVRLGDDYYCIEDLCTHDGQPLTDGEIDQNCIVCPRHGAKFDLATGDARRMPATEAVRTFAVEVRPEGVFVQSPG